MINTLYVVGKCISKEIDEIKINHGSNDANYTICGKELNADLIIINNTHDGIITCKKCIKILKEKYGVKVNISFIMLQMDLFMLIIKL